MTTDVKLCPCCNQEKPTAAFSTLTERALDIKRPIGAYCIACYWMQLVTHHPSYRIGEDGKCIVDYVPFPAPRFEYVVEMRQWLPRRLADGGIQAAFADLGSLDEQVRPFREFSANIVDSMGESSG